AEFAQPRPTGRYYFGSLYWWDIFCPLRRTTARNWPAGDPSLSGCPVTVTLSPGTTLFGVQPSRVKALGAAISNDHSVVLPLASVDTTCSQLCGFTKRNSFTVPCTSKVLVASNMAKE